MAQIARRLMVVVFSVLLMNSSQAYGADGKESIKAAMVFNIIRFIDFPQSLSEVTICVSSGDPVARHLAKVSGRRLGGSKVRVLVPASVQQFDSRCDVMYVDSGAPNARIHSRDGQVLIGSNPYFAAQGGTIGFVRFGNQMRFEINQRRATEDRIQFRAQLMDLAARIYS